MAGYEWQRYHREGKYFGESITKPDYIYQAEEVEWATRNQLVSFFGRVNYSLLNKYLFTGTLRADGSSSLLRETNGAFSLFCLCMANDKRRFSDK